MFVGDMINPETGKTWKDENLEKGHNLPLGCLVRVKDTDRYNDGGGLVLYVARHSRDCDGSPLYSLTHDVRYVGYEFKDNEYFDRIRDGLLRTLAIYTETLAKGAMRAGFDEDSLEFVRDMNDYEREILEDEANM